MTTRALLPIRSAFRFNPRDPDFQSDPYPCYAFMRHDRPAHRAGGAVILTRREHVGAALANRDLGAASLPATILALAAKWRIEMPNRVRDDIARLLAPEYHALHAESAPLRDWVDHALSHTSLATMRAMMRVTVESRLARIKARRRSTLDLVQEVAQPLWPDVLAAWGGLAEQQRRRLHHLGRTAQLLLDPGRLSPTNLPSLVAAVDELHRIFALAYRQQSPRQAVPNLFWSLETAWMPAVGDVEDKIPLAGMLLLLAGSETASALIGNLFNILADRPDLIARLRAKPDSSAAFVAEALRYDPPRQMARRIALKDTRAGGLPVRRGDDVLLCLASANRDESCIGNAERFDPHREPVSALSAVSGMHGALSLALAQAQAEVTLEAFLSCFDRIERTPDGTIWQTRNPDLRTLAHLSLRVGP
jgi:cytochrome P450